MGETNNKESDGIPPPPDTEKLPRISSEMLDSLAVLEPGVVRENVLLCQKPGPGRYIMLLSSLLLLLPFGFPRQYILMILNGRALLWKLGDIDMVRRGVREESLVAEAKLSDVNVEFVSFGRPVLSFPTGQRAIVEGKVQIEQLRYLLAKQQYLNLPPPPADFPREKRDN